ncbi:hypothetical protein ACLB2K_041624 [Fragaria x ananassa]
MAPKLAKRPSSCRGSSSTTEGGTRKSIRLAGSKPMSSVSDEVRSRSAAASALSPASERVLLKHLKNNIASLRRSEVSNNQAAPMTTEDEEEEEEEEEEYSHKEMNPPKLDQEFRLHISRKWKDLPSEEKEQYVFPDRHAQNSNSYYDPDSRVVYWPESRCLPERFKNLVATFSQEKNAACSALGFGPLIKIAGKTLNHIIMRNIDSERCTLEMHRKQLEISSRGCIDVLGLNNVGDPVDFDSDQLRNHPHLMQIAEEFSRKYSKINVKEVEDYLREA